MKKYILFFGSLLALAGCQEERKNDENNVVEDTMVESLPMKESSSELASESSDTSDREEERDDLVSVFNQDDFQAGFQELIDFIAPEEFLLPTTFTEKPEADYFSGYTYSMESGGFASIHIVESASPITENIDVFEEIEGEARTNFSFVAYGTPEAAENQVQHEDAHQIWLENQYNQQTLEFDLGHGVTGYMIGNTADQTLGWNDGKWYVEFYSYEFENKEIIANLGRQLVQQLQNAPLPTGVGTGHYYLSYDGMTGEWFSRVLWTVDEVRYEINTSRKGTAAVVDMARDMMGEN